MKIFLLFILRLLSWIDYAYRALVRWILPFPYRRAGRCRQCGECCKNILIGIEPRMLRIAALRNFAIWWNKYFNNLYLIGSFLDDGLMVFGCNYLRDDGRCGNYNLSRPVFCFEYPRLFKYFEKPVELPGCGFKFVARK
ncbi:MAG: YkgJ family cysteine cluster protein [Candidatus Margulisbacteria bacterium]|nr:YkgJ family cysteine cluster protein [Candidatus Margulisiibacteriota bacterium]